MTDATGQCLWTTGLDQPVDPAEEEADELGEDEVLADPEDFDDSDDPDDFEELEDCDEPGEDAPLALELLS